MQDLSPSAASDAMASFEALVAGLLQPSAYPEPADRVTRIDTHISAVLLAGAYAYKLRKPLNLGFLDFSTLERRRQDCAEEVRLNRRTAPDIYLDVVGVAGPMSAPRLVEMADASQSSVLDYAVRMRRFDAERTFDRLARRGRLSQRRIEQLAAAIAAFHDRAERVPEKAVAERMRRWVEDNLAELRSRAQSPADRERLDALAAWTNREAQQQAPRMAARAEAGMVRDVHGDLHLGNVVLVGGTPRLFDAIEFNDGLRRIDVMADIAFTFMDLVDHGLRSLAWRLTGDYVERTGDYDGLALLRYFAVYRALVRAKVALIRLQQPQQTVHARLREHTSFEHYLALAERLSAPSPPMLVAMTGLSGSGKSTVARQLAAALGGVCIRSDVERRRLAGLPRTGATEGAIYTAEATASTYARLEELARIVIAAGLPVVVDAASLRRVERRRFMRLADAIGVPARLVVCEAPLQRLRGRLARRARAAADPSEADAAVLERQLAWREPLEDDERDRASVIETGRGPAQLRAQCDALAADLLASSA